MNSSSSLKLIFLFVCAFAFTNARANIFRVNNNLATDKTKNIFASLQEAHDASAGAGTDTLLIEGSTKEYAGFDCSKKLVIIGPGYFLTQNGGQASSLSATVQAINFNPGSDGSVIMGLLFSSASGAYHPNIYTNGIAIIRCNLPNGIVIAANITSLVILQNYIGANIAVSSGVITFSGVIVKNNIMNELDVTSSTGYPRIFATVEHNIINSYAIFTASICQSNILTYGSINITSNTIQNNLAASNTVAAIPTNLLYQNGQTFIGSTAANGSPDGQYKLPVNSPYAAAGYNGEQIGAFGGTEPYVISGIPPIPTIYQLQTDAIANKQDGLNVTIKARANQ